MTDVEIVNALKGEIRIGEHIDGFFADCISIELLKNILALIERQKAEIEQLQNSKCLYAFDGETLEYCVQAPCPNYQPEHQTKVETKEEAEKALKEREAMAEYIEREKALEIIDRIFFSTDPTGDEQIGVLKCRTAIREEIPAADVAEVKRGQWITDENGVVICSECGEEHEWQDFRPPYCDMCGAKMDLGR